MSRKVIMLDESDQPKTMRQRYRSEVRAQIKEVAEHQLATVGPTGLSLSAIARELGTSAPALYRYFDSRDALLTELVIDAYNDLAEILSTELGKAAGAPTESPITFLRAYRSWATEHPHRYRLLFQSPVPGFDPNAGALVEAAQRSMNLLISTLSTQPPDLDLPKVLSEQLSTWAIQNAPDTQTATALRATLIWSHIHGFVSLEIANIYATMGIDADALFEIQLQMEDQ
jgi:AcrR family transcriptional regulator